MALHGQIAINGIAIGQWGAQRMDLLRPGQDIYQYDCDVRMFRSQDRPGSRFTFVIDHHYGQGSVVLAARVLAKAAELGA